MSRVSRGLALALIAASLASTAAMAANASKPAAPGNSLLPGGNSKEPISIDADKLNYYDKEQKAIYTGNVVVIQGDSKMTCSVMTIFLAKADAPPAGASANAAVQPASAQSGSDVGTPGGSQVSHMDATGPVTIVSKTQVATGDKASYDKVQNKVWLFGNVTLSDGGNISKGERLTYNLTTGEATIDPGKGDHRVHVIIDQSSGSGDDANKPATPDKPAAKKDKEKEAAPAPSEKTKSIKKQAAGEAPAKP